MAKASYDVPAVRKAISLLNILSESRNPLGVSEIARLLESNKNMTFRLLTTLEDEGWIRQVEGPKYIMTLQPFQITSKPVARMTVKEAATEPLHKLWEETGESVYLGILSDNHVLYLEHFDSTQDVKVAGTIGGKYPLHCTAPGKVLLAYSSENYIQSVLESPLKQYTENTICDKNKFMQELKLIKKQGWARDNEELGRGIVCLAVPIFNYEQIIIGTIGMSVSTLAYDINSLKDKMLQKLISTGKEISHFLGSDNQANHKVS